MSDIADKASSARERMSMIEPDWPEWLFHVQRYAYASTFATGKRVLDCASGEGYGAELLSRHAAECVGVDIDAAAVAEASVRYSSRPNLAFLEGSITNLPFADGSFGLITCFETIEHIGEADQVCAIAELRRVLVPGGILLLSTPDRLVSEQRGYHNRFHLRELSVADVEALVEPHFRFKTALAQELNMMSALSPLAATDTSSSIVAFADLQNDATLTLHAKQASHFYLLFVLTDHPCEHPQAHAFGAYARAPAFQLWNRIDQLGREVEDCRAGNETLRAETAECQLRCEMLRLQLGTRDMDCDALKRELKSSEQRNRSLGALVGELQASDGIRSALEGRLALLESKLWQMTERLADAAPLPCEVARSGKQPDQWPRLAGTEQPAGRIDTVIARLAARIEAVRKDLEESRARATTAEALIAECEDRASSENAANKRLALALEQLATKTAALEKELAAAKIRATSIELHAAEIAGQLKSSEGNNRLLANELLKINHGSSPSYERESVWERLRRLRKKLSDKQRWKERRRRARARFRRLLERTIGRTAHHGY